MTPAQAAVAWLLAQKLWIATIPGTRSSTRLQENLGATMIALGAAELSELRTVMEAHAVTGDRYPPEFKKMSGR